ncbi:MAG: LicD family protein [Selenomonadaceae bacterium]|nr:LicD family protein [Selenomonadaceae bacterium]
MAETISVTVILATNGNATRACIESVLAQTVSDFELIIVGSPIGGLDDSRIKFIPVDKNLNSARNVGLEHAVGTFVYFIDGEGMILDNALEVLLNAARESGAEVVQSTTLIERDGEDLSVAVDQKMLSLNLYRRDFLERANLKFPESIEDAEPFCFAAESMAPTVAFIDDYFYVRTRQKKLREEPVYVKDMERDEIRSGFLVTSQRKKLWNAQIKLIFEFDRVCRKHGWKWYPYAGTLLGAARHKGFIPWDDDVDLAMFRPDFDEFIKIAPSELNPKYFLDAWHNHAIEGEPNPENLPLVDQQTAEQIRERGWWWPLCADFIKLRDSSTAMIQWPERRNVNQGIWIDIFPLDPAPPFGDERRYVEFAIKKELFLTAAIPGVIENAMSLGEELNTPYDQLRRLLKLPFKQRALFYEHYALRNFFETERCTRLSRYFLKKNCFTLSVSGHREQVPLPFEMIELPAPSGYDDVLSDIYGDWHTLMMNSSHVTAYSVDLSYKEYFDKISPGIRVHMF